MFGGRMNSWNPRDRHMQQTLEALLVHFKQTAGTARAVIRATIHIWEMLRRRTWGRLVNSILVSWYENDSATASGSSGSRPIRGP